MVNNCPKCLEKQRKIDNLTEEVIRLKAKLGLQERKRKEGAFGSSTPSSKIPVKPNKEERDKKKRGGRPGHEGNGRKRFDDEAAARVIQLESGQETCPDCGGELKDKGLEKRMAVEAFPVEPQKVLYRLPKKYCPHCRRTFRTKPPGLLPKSLYGNQLIANAVEAHYLHGIPMGRICEQTGLGPGVLVEIFRRVARLFEDAPKALLEEFRQAPVKHADETSWRTDGKNGYVWLFATPDLSVFQFGKNRSAAVPKAVFGPERLPGVLVVDRYASYNQVPCEIQYCFAHLLRDVTDLEKNFPGEPEVERFVGTSAPLLSLAMGLRSQKLSETEFAEKASRLKSEIEAVMDAPARHLGVRHIQDIFRENRDRLYHWAKDRRVPAENNLAERDLRPSVIARKVSFGSATDAGAHIRSVLTTVLVTLKKRRRNPGAGFKEALDALAQDSHQDPIPLLFPKPLPP